MGTNAVTYTEITIAEVQQSMLAGELTAAELVSWYLERIGSLDKEGPSINAIVNVNPRALEEAEALDRYLKANGQLKGKLHGVPVLVKDQAETAGIPTTFGSKAFHNYIPEQDATLITRLREAGAVILAKTSMCDFAAGWFSFSSETEHTRNPYAGERETGGSSAGTSAGIAANFGLVGIGEDTGGSIRLPSSFNNLFGLRVTTGLVSRAGFSPLVHFQDTPGPIGRTVRDTARLLDVIAGYDPNDSFTAAAVQSEEIGHYEDMLESADLTGKRIGILREAFGPDSDPDCEPVNRQVSEAIERLRSLGAEIVEDVTIPDLQEYLAETSLYAMQSKFDIDNFLSKRPDAPLHSFMEVYESNGFHELNDLFHDIAAGPDDPAESPDYYRQRLAQEEFRRAILGVFAKHSLDTIIYPAVRVLPPTREALAAGKWTCLTFPTNTVIASQSILPSLSVPAGLTEDGIPVGLEMLGLPFKEGKLLQLGYAYEQAVQPRQAPVLADRLLSK
ncbi:amidase [Paenibacillus sp. PK3_47]|uniref:amidase n=1 Tax=Paenibacillus sp. PK3_47 TaxID=2072642 RepID=UPI00201E2D40|nr:amidase [Paenibacillus sp. PK3_47]UQZ33237.1 amidase [Paenibacillus sp. PK3_47]